MEVHHHTNQSPKKFSHYLWEFLMLFLAVFCGFLAENLREHQIERRREKQYIISFTDDLKKDISQLDSLIQKRETRRIQIDSINNILRSADPDQYGKQLYYFSRYLPRPFNYVANNATILQLRNSGNLRLIHNQDAVDTMLAYDRQSNFIEYIRTREEQLIMRIFPYMDQLFDPDVFDQMNLYDIEFKEPPGNPRLLNKDPKLIREFRSELHYLKTVNIGQVGWFRRQKERAQNTLEFLKKEYHL